MNSKRATNTKKASTTNHSAPPARRSTARPTARSAPKAAHQPVIAAVGRPRARDAEEGVDVVWDVGRRGEGLVGRHQEEERGEEGAPRAEEVTREEDRQGVRAEREGQDGQDEGELVDGEDAVEQPAEDDVDHPVVHEVGGVEAQVLREVHQREGFARVVSQAEAGEEGEPERDRQDEAQPGEPPPRVAAAAGRVLAHRLPSVSHSCTRWLYL